MSNDSIKYFESLLAESRAECRKYSAPRREDVLTLLKGNAEAFRQRDEALKKLEALKKKKAPKEELDAADKEYKDLRGEANRRQDESMDALVPIVTNDIRLDLEPESLHVHLMKCAIIARQGPKEMAEFCQNHGDQYAKELLENEDVMREMLLNGGARNGKFLEAYKLFDELMELLEADESMASDCHRRLAMGTALELVAPPNIFDSTTEFVDPKQRFLHYVQAHLNGELDPAFPYFTTWEYRHIVNSDATDEELQWGRDQLKRYNPALVNTDSSAMKYCKQVRSDVGYRTPNWGTGQRTYRKLISGGGKCGARAWMGRFLCKAFGTPAWGVKQPGHAAIARWTPDSGWETCFGAGMHYSYWENRTGPDFQYEAHARHFQKDLDVYFKRVTLLECMAEANKEPTIGGDPKFIGPSSFWRALVWAQRRHWCFEAKKVKGCFERGPPPGEEPEDCDIRSYIARTDDPVNDNQTEILAGTIRVPACAFVKRGGVDVNRCFSGGGQVNFRQEPGVLEYKLPESVPRQDYQLRFKICTVHLAHESTLFCISVNSVAVCEVPVLYTVGEWKYTNPIAVNLGGGDSINITRKKSDDVQFWGLALRELVFEST
jgi:hypothetical protein